MPVMSPYTGDSKPKLKKLSRVLSSSSAHLPLTATPSNDSMRSAIVPDGPSEQDFSYSPILYAANEMMKNLFDMATDSFGLKAGNYGLTDTLNGMAVPHYGSNVLSIYHPGAVTAIVDLLPAICDVAGDGQMVPCTDVSVSLLVNSLYE